MSKKLGMLTVIGKDRPGIIAEVSGALYRGGCNLEDMSMTRLEQQLAMMMIVCYEERGKKKPSPALEILSKKSGMSFYWKDLPVKLSSGRFGRDSKSLRNSDMTCLVTAIGKDRTGIVYEVSRLMASFKLNITDLNSRIIGSASKPLYSMMLEAEIPKNFKLLKLTKSASVLAKKLNMEIQIKPVQRVQC